MSSSYTGLPRKLLNCAEYSFVIGSVYCRLTLLASSFLLLPESFSLLISKLSFLLTISLLASAISSVSESGLPESLSGSVPSESGFGSKLFTSAVLESIGFGIGELELKLGASTLVIASKSTVILIAFSQNFD